MPPALGRCSRYREKGTWDQLLDLDGVGLEGLDSQCRRSARCGPSALPSHMLITLETPSQTHSEVCFTSSQGITWRSHVNT